MSEFAYIVAAVVIGDENDRSFLDSMWRMSEFSTKSDISIKS